MLIRECDHRIWDQVLLSTIIEQTEDSIVIMDNHRTIIYVNPSFERSSGYTCEELMGKPLRTVRSDQHDNAFFRKMKKILDNGETWIGNLVNKGKGGVDFEIDGTITPIRNAASGAITHYVAVGRNMGRFRKLERELQRVQKMDALGTLAGGIAHDFNNILTSVMGFIEMEFLGAALGSRTRNRMEKALAACGRARDLVKQILTFSTKVEQRHKPLRIGPVVEDALQMMRATLPATIAIRTELTEEQALILGDPTQIHQIVVNLCTNAAYAMKGSGGSLEISLKGVEIDDTHVFEHPNLLPGSYLCLAVSDTGEGMDRETRERIFEPFFTTKAQGEGAGVGLSVVHGIVKSYGGKIVVRSELGKGSTFELFFPRIEGVEEQSERLPELSPGGNERILLVDDEEFVVAMASEMLHNLGYEVTSVQESYAALEIFRSQPNRFHLIITDQTMPGLTGMELATKILQVKQDTPIILCTGYSNENVWEAALAIGIRKILSKPFVLNELASSVREVLDQSRNVQIS